MSYAGSSRKWEILFQGVVMMLTTILAGISTKTSVENQELKTLRCGLPPVLKFNS